MGRTSFQAWARDRRWADDEYRQASSIIDVRERERAIAEAGKAREIYHRALKRLLVDTVCYTATVCYCTGVFHGRDGS